MEKTPFLIWTAVFLAAAAPGLADDAVTVGAPWTGAPGIGQSTSAIMARDKIQTGQSHPRHIAPRHVLPPAATFKYGTQAEASSISSALFAQTVATNLNFTAANFNDCSGWPPDTMGAIGPTQFITALNGRIRSFNKFTGAADGAIDANTDTFFSSVVTPGLNFTTDPRIRYDRLSGRWFVIMIDVPGQQGKLPNRVMIAMSDSGTITPSTVWTFFEFAGDASNFADYPTLGVDANALYIGANIFSTSSGSFVNTSAFVVRKSSLLSGGPIVVTAFTGLITGRSFKTGPYTPQGVDNFNPAATEGYFIGVDYQSTGSTGNTLQLRRVSSPGGTPSLSGNVSISVTTFATPVNVTPLGSSGAVDGLDQRLLAAHFRNGSLWTSHNVGVNSSGGTSSPDRNGVRWYQITNVPAGQTPSVRQSGTLYQPGSTNLSYWMGTIMVSGQGHAAMGFTAAGPNSYLNAATSGRLVGDTNGTMQLPIIYTASSSAYNPSDGSSPHRWGDYSYTSLDPADDMTMWTVQEWCQFAGDGFAVQVAKLLAPPPVVPTNCSPSTVTQGVASVSVVIRGIGVNGTGFFEPGTNFQNHLNVAVSGGDISVTNIVVNSPTNLTVSLTIASNALSGARTITVTNPDGQSATSATGLLTVVGTGVAPSITNAVTNQTIQCGSNAAFSVAATGSPPLHYQWSLDGSTISAATNTSLSLTNVHLPNHTVAIVVTNLYGSATSSATLFVQDTLPPTITLNGTNPFYVEFGGTFVDPGATATDICAGVVAVFASGTVNTNTVSTNIVTYTAGDGNGNTNSVARTVIVRDTTPPTILWSFTNLELAAVNGSATMPNVTGTNYIRAVDLSPPLTIAQSPTNGTILPVGTNLVVLAVADAWNNAAYSTNHVIVVTNATPLIAVAPVFARGSITLDLGGAPGFTYILETTTNLALPPGWQPLATNIMGTNGVWQFTDFGVTNLPDRFYRLKLAQ